MIRIVLIAATAATAIGSPAMAAAPVKHLCGWVSNPTPGNWWLNDKDAQWIIGTQGGKMAEGDLPSFDKGKQYWVATQANGYGYGCGCITASIDPGTTQIARILKAKVQKLTVCQHDKTLVEPK